MSALDKFLASVQPEHHVLVRTLDSLVRKAAPELTASLKWGNLTYHHMRNVCSLAAHAHHVNLQVWGGAALPDPYGLLTGTGKVMRHIKFGVDAKINRSALVAVIKHAMEATRA